MKNNLKFIAIFISCAFKIIAQQALQQNEFKIGMFGASSCKVHFIGCDVPFETPIDNGYKTSVLNVLAADGFNIVQTYEPTVWTSLNFFKSYLKLAQANGLKVEVTNSFTYKPAVDINNNYLGYCTFDSNNCGISLGDCQTPYSQNYFKPNVQSFMNNIYTITPYKDIIWGYHIGEESSYFHLQHSTLNCQGNTLTSSTTKNVEVTPAAVNTAMSYYKNKLSIAGITNHKTVIMEANHVRSIHANTIDYESGSLYNPQQYIQLLNKNDNRDVFFEGSYAAIQPYWRDFKYADIAHTGPNNNWHYLGSFKSIDFAKNYSNSIHKVIDINGDQNSEPTVPNANWLWFQAYNSIIHGAKGIWFWAINAPFNNCLLVDVLTSNGVSMLTIINKVRSYYPSDPILAAMPDNQITCTSTVIISSGVTVGDLVAQAAKDLLNAIPSQYDKNYFPKVYKDFVSNLSSELRLLSNINIISSDLNTIVATKTDGPDPNCIIPLITPTNSNYIKTGLINKFGSTGGFPNIPTADFGDLNTENYGLRYTIRTNGSETYMIITNPLNVAVTTTLNFSNSSNEIIKKSTGVAVMFENNANPVTSTNYKVNRNSNINLSTNTVGNQYNITYLANMQLPISFGPMDVKILKFISIPLPNYENGWTNTWSNFGSGNINDHIVKPNDLVYTGDYDGGGDEELLIVNNTGNASDKMTLLKFVNANWTIIWTNTNYNYEHGMFAYRANLIVGDYDGDGKDELLGNMPLPSGWTTLFKYNTTTKDWDWKWSDNGNPHPIRPYKGKMYAVDFDGLDAGKKEIFGCDLTTNGYTREIRWDNNTNNFILAGWVDTPSDAIRGYRTNLLVGNFNGYSGSEVLGLNTWGTLFDFKNGNWGWAWSTGGSGSFGGWVYPFNANDKTVVGNFDNDSNDEIIMIQTGSTASYATSLDYKLVGAQWNWNWNWSTHNVNPAIPFIDNWSLSDDGGSDTRYFAIKPIASEPKQLLALRKYGCNNSYFVSMYKRNNIYANYKVQNINQDETITDNKISLYPNPANETVSIKIDSEIKSNDISLFDSQGRLILEFLNQRNELSIDLTGYRKGIYFVKVKNVEMSSVKKLVIN